MCEGGEETASVWEEVREAGRDWRKEDTSGAGDGRADFPRGGRGVRLRDDETTQDSLKSSKPVPRPPLLRALSPQKMADKAAQLAFTARVGAACDVLGALSEDVDEMGGVYASSSSSSSSSSPAGGPKRGRIDELLARYAPADGGAGAGAGPATATAARETSSSASSSGDPVSRCRPWSRADQHARAATFRGPTWFGKPESLNPLQCARFGWVNDGVDRLACRWCGASLAVPPTTPSPATASASAAADVRGRLRTEHADQCPWRGLACPADFACVRPHPGRLRVSAFLGGVAGAESALAAAAAGAAAGGHTSGAGPATLRLDPSVVPELLVALSAHAGTVSAAAARADAQAAGAHASRRAAATAAAAAAAAEGGASTAAATVFVQLLGVLRGGEKEKEGAAGAHPHPHPHPSLPTTTASALPVSSLSALLTDPALLPALLTLFGWTAAAGSGELVGAVGGADAEPHTKRRRASSSSLPPATPPASALHCALCGRTSVLADLVTAAAAAAAGESAGVGPGGALERYQERLRGKTAAAAAAAATATAASSSSLSSGAGAAAPRRTLAEAARSTMAAASRALAAFSRVVGEGDSSGSADAAAPAAAATAAAAPAAAPAPLHQPNEALINPLRGHAWYCAYARAACPLPLSLAAAVADAARHWDRVREKGGRIVLPAGPRARRASAASGQAQSTLSGASSSGVTRAVAAGLAAMGAASVGVADVDAVTRLLIASAHQEQAEAGRGAGAGPAGAAAGGGVQEEAVRQLQALLGGEAEWEGEGDEGGVDGSTLGGDGSAPATPLAPGWLLASLALYASLGGE
jgi:hypothetical protein